MAQKVIEGVHYHVFNMHLKRYCHTSYSCRENDNGTKNDYVTRFCGLPSRNSLPTLKYVN